MIRIDDSVITAQVLQDKLGSERAVELCPRAKLTPRQSTFYASATLKSCVEAGSSERAGGSPAASASRQRRDFKGIFCPNIVISMETVKSTTARWNAM